MIVTRAVDGTRTRGLHLGKVALHQLRYYRMRIGEMHGACVLRPRCQRERPQPSVCRSPTACGLVVHKSRSPTHRQSKTMQPWKTGVATCPLLAQCCQCLCVPPLGLEPRTHDLRGRCYYQLSYRGKAYERLVGLAGVEPATSSASWKRSAS